MPIQLGSNVKLFAVFSITAFHLFFHFSANAAIFGWGRAKKSCELALSMNGAEVQIDEILAGKPTLLKILSENVWTKDYAATLATLGEDSIAWTVSSDGRQITGTGLWTPSIGHVRVVLSKDSPDLEISPGKLTRPTEFFVEVFVHPDRLDNAKTVIVEAGIAMRAEKNSGDFPKFAVSLRQEPLTEGAFKGYHRLILPLSVFAILAEDGKSVAVKSFTVANAPVMALTAEGYLRHLALAAMFKPLQVLP